MIINKTQRGFTLVELSIVLLIIGLITGGITGGATLIKQAKIRSIINDINVISTAINAFKTQFNALPGDFNNAYSFWPSSTCTISSCNGNGDSKIDFDEQFHVWQHLSLAEFIQGSYQGTAAAINKYQSKYTNGTYDLRYINSWIAGPSFNSLELGKYLSAGYSGNSLILPLEAYNIDLKIDDGLANSGFIQGIDGEDASSGACSYSYYSYSTPTALYNLTNKQIACRIHKNID